MSEDSLAQEQIARAQQLVDRTDPDDPALPGRLSNLAAHLVISHRQQPDATALDRAVESLTHAADLTDQGPLRAVILANLVTARLDRTDDRTEAEEFGECAELLEEALGCDPPDDRIAPIQALLGEVRYAIAVRTGSTDAIATSAAELGRAVELTPVDDARRSARCDKYGVALMMLGERTRDESTWAAAVAMFSEVLDGIDARDHRRAGALGNLGRSLRALAEIRGDAELLERSIAALAAAARTAPPADPDAALHRSNLGNALLTRFTSSRSSADLDTAIVLLRQAVATAHPDDLRRGMFLGNLALMLLTRARAASDVAGASDLDAAIEAFTEATTDARSPTPVRASHQVNLIGALLNRSHRPGHAEDAIAARELARDVIAGTEPGTAIHTAALASLAAAIEREADGHGHELLYKAIALYEDAVRATGAGDRLRAQRLSNLANARRRLGEAVGDDVHLRDAETALREAISLVTEVAAGPYRANLAAVLIAVSEHTASDRLEEAVALAEQAVNDDRATTSERAARLANLAICRLEQAERSPGEQHLAQALAAATEAVRLTAADDPGLPQRWTTLANVLRLRSRRTDSRSDLGAAVGLLRRAIVRTADDDAARPGRLSNLGDALRLQADRGRFPEILDEAIVVLRLALSLSSGGIEAAGLNSNLGSALQTRGERDCDPADLHEAVDHLEQAVARSVQQPHRQVLHLSNLGNALLSEAVLDVDQDRARRAAAVQLQALELIPDGDPRRVTVRLNLVAALLAADGPGPVAGRSWQVRDLVRELAREKTAQAPDRLVAAWRWADLEAGQGDPGQAAAAMDLASTLWDRALLAVGESSDREHLLARFAGLAEDAAASHLGAGSAEAALMALEHGRGTIWGRVMGDRLWLTLQGLRPELDESLQRVRRELDGGADARLHAPGTMSPGPWPGDLWPRSGAVFP